MGHELTLIWDVSARQRINLLNAGPLETFLRGGGNSFFGAISSLFASQNVDRCLDKTTNWLGK